MKEYRKSEWKGALKAIFIVAVLCVGIGIAVAAWDDTKNTGDNLTAAEWNAQVTDQKNAVKKDGSVAMEGDLLPDNTGIRKLGSTTKRWGDIYSDNHYIYNTLYGGFKVGQDFLPNADETHKLGNATYKWDMVWARTVDFNSVCTDLMNRMSAGDYINFTDGISFNGASGQSIVNVAHILPKTTGASDLGSSALKFRNVYTGNIIAWDGLSGGIKCEQDWIPKTNSTYDLGSVSYYWDNMFLNGYIDLKGSLYTSTISEQPGGAGVTIDGCLIKDGYPYIPNHTPSSASEACAAGQICYDSNYTYVCIATDTWERAALSSW